MPTIMKKFSPYLNLLISLTTLMILVLSTELPAQKSYVPTTINDFFLAGSQPGESGTITNPDQCYNCHQDSSKNVTLANEWRGSMMAQAARDPLFYAGMAIANQDAPESGDLCIRCHSPSGWLEGRSVPTDGSALNKYSP